MIHDWRIIIQPPESKSRYRLMHDGADLCLAGPQLDRNRFIHQRSADPEWVVFYVLYPHLSPDAHRVLRDTFPNVEIDASGDYVYMPLSDYAIIKLAAS